MPTNNHIYDKDFYAWTKKTAELIRQGKFSEIDIENVAEEIESMGNKDKRELINRLALIISHLLKFHFQPERRSRSWRNTIAEQRVQIAVLLRQSPSLTHEISDTFEEAYHDAVKLAVADTRVDKKTFPKHCPFTLKECLDDNYLPDGGKTN